MEFIEKILPTVLVVATGLLTWFLKDKSEKLKLQREKLLEEKRLNYENILEPIIRLFVGTKGDKKETEKAMKQILSFDYKKTSFQLMLFGSDSVVQAYNDYLQYMYKNEDNLNASVTLKLLGKVLLEIRKDLGNPTTDLEELDMLRFMITDIDELSIKD